MFGSRPGGDGAPGNVFGSSKFSGGGGSNNSAGFMILTSAAFLIHLILTWIRIRILGSTFRKSGSGSSDPGLEKMDPDPGPKWIRIRVPIFHNPAKCSGSGWIRILIRNAVKLLLS